MSLLLASGTLSIGVVFWIVMLILLIFGFWGNWPVTGTPVNWRPLGTSLALWFLLFLIGWQVWGFPIGAAR